MKKSNLQKVSTEKTFGIISIFLAILLTPNLVSLGNTTINHFSKAPEEKVISIEDENKSEQKENILYVDGVSWRDGDRHFHVTPENDTIVSHANREVAERKRTAEKEATLTAMKENSSRGVTDLVYDVTDPSFGLVPYRHGNDTIPLNDDISIKNRTNRTSQLVAEIAADQTDQINPSSSGWGCNQFSAQDATINKFGVYDIENSTLNSNATLPFDFSYNGQGEIPAYRVTTRTTDGVPHAICGAFVGSVNGVEYNDATDFSQYYFWEPQTDAHVQPGDYSMDANHPVSIQWYGYEYFSAWEEWSYGTREILDFNLTNGTPTNTFTDPYLTQYFTPFDQVSYPEDQTHQFPADTTVATNGEPTNLYNAMAFIHTDASTQNSDPNDPAHYNYTVTRTFDGVDGDYNSTNTGAAIYDQLIHSEDTEPPVRNSDGTWTDNSGLVDIVYDTESTQGTDPTQCDYYNYTVTETETATDPCENEAIYEGETQYFSDDEPPVYANGAWTDNSGVVNVAYETVSTQGDDPNECDYYNYTETITETATDPCSNEATYTHDPQSFSDTEGAYVIPPTPFPAGETVYRQHPDDSPDPTAEEWADFGDTQSPVEKYFNKEVISEDDLHTLYEISQYGEDACLNDPQDYFDYYVHVPKPSGIEQKVAQDRASVYPNPTASNMTIKYNSQEDQEVRGTLYNMHGQQVGNDLYHLSAGENKIPLSLTNLKPGMYFLKLENDVGLKHIIRVIKKTN